MSSINLGLMTIPKLTGSPRVEQVSSLFQENVLEQLWSNFKDFLILFTTQDDGHIWNALPPYGFLYFFCLPLLLVGLYYSFRNLKNKQWNPEIIMLIWFFTAVLMACITDVNINRINIIYFPAIYFVARGVWAIKGLYTKLFIPIMLAFSICFISFTYVYFTKFPEQISNAFFESLGDALEYAAEETDGKIAVTNEINMPYIFALFYEKTDPHEFIDTVQYVNPGAAFQYVASFGRYYFGDNYSSDPTIAALVIPNHQLSQYANGNYQIKSFKHYSVAIRTGEPIDIEETPISSETNLIENGGFEQLTEGWTFIGPTMME